MVYAEEDSSEIEAIEDAADEEKKDDSVYFKFLSDFANSDEEAN